MPTVVTINRPDVVALIQSAADKLTGGNKTEAVALAKENPKLGVGLHIALLHGREPLQLAASGGGHRGTDVVRLLMAGACCTQVVGALLRHGPQRLSGLRDELSLWLAEHDYGSVSELIGCMAQHNAPDPAHYERTPYLRSLQTFRPLEAMRAAGPW